MAQIQLSLNEIINWFANFATEHKQINTFGFGPKYEIAETKSPNYPLLWLEPISSRIRKDSVILKWNIYFLDQVQKDLSNQQQVHSDQYQTLLDLRTAFYKDFYYDFFPADEDDIEPKFEVFNDDISGWMMVATLAVDYLQSACDIPGVVFSGTSFQGTSNYFNVNLSNFLPHTGGILSGPLSGTSADFMNYYSAGTPLDQIIFNIADSLSGLGHDFYTTAATLHGTTAFFTRNDLLSAYTLDLSSLSGGSSGSLWSASTGVNSIIANNNTGNLASNNYGIIIGKNNKTSGLYSGILGGKNNLNKGYGNTILNGFNNYANKYAALSFIGNGRNNLVHNSSYAWIGNGRRNYVYGQQSTVVNGSYNSATTAYAGVGGGIYNGATGQYASVINGKNNLASGQQSIILNGYNNLVTGQRSSILGGHNIIGNENDTAYVPFLNIQSLSSSTSIYTLGIDASGYVVTASTGSIVAVQNGLNTYTAGTFNAPSVNVSAATLDHIFVSGYSTFNLLSATTFSAGTYYSGSTPLETIITNISNSLTNAGETFVQPGLNTYTGGTAFRPTVNLSSATLNTLTVSGSTSLGSVSATTYYSGSTPLAQLFLGTATTFSSTFLNKGLNTYTGGTTLNPSVNVSAATLDHIFVSGYSTFNLLSATTFSGANIILNNIGSNANLVFEVIDSANTVTSFVKGSGSALFNNMSATTITATMVSATTITATTYYGLPDVFGVSMDGSGGVLSTGVTGYRTMTTSGTITGWNLLSNITGNVIMDIWKVSGGVLPTVANTITDGSKPQLTAALYSASTAVNTWTGLTFSSGDIFGFNIISVTGITKLNLTIPYLKS